MAVRRIISGGQTGADRAGLDAGRLLALEIGGYCPKGRRAEDGQIPDEYPLIELSSAEYPPRTRANVEASDATLIFTAGAPDRGTALTIRLANKAKKPLLCLDVAAYDVGVIAEKITPWLAEVRPRTLNIAGSRESTSPGIYDRVKAVLLIALAIDEGEED